MYRTSPQMRTDTAVGPYQSTDGLGDLRSCRTTFDLFSGKVDQATQQVVHTVDIAGVIPFFEGLKLAFNFIQHRSRRRPSDGSSGRQDRS